MKQNENILILFIFGNCLFYVMYFSVKIYFLLFNQRDKIRIALTKKGSQSFQFD